MKLFEKCINLDNRILNICHILALHNLFYFKHPQFKMKKQLMSLKTILVVQILKKFLKPKYDNYKIKILQLNKIFSVATSLCPTSTYWLLLICMFVSSSYSALPDRISVEKVFFQLVCIVLFFFKNIIYWCSIPGHKHNNGELMANQTPQPGRS